MWWVNLVSDWSVMSSACVCVRMLLRLSRTHFACLFLFLCLSVCLSVSYSSIWFSLIPLPSSNPSFSLSSFHSIYALCFSSSPSHPSSWFSLDCCIARRRCVFYTAAIHLALSPEKNTLWWTDAWVPDCRNMDMYDRQTWVGTAQAVWATFGQMVQSYRPLFIKCTSSLCLASPRPPASRHSGTREN